MMATATAEKKKGEAGEKKKEKAAQELHTPEKFDKLYGEWITYQKRVEHPESGKDVSKAQIMQEELTDRVEALQRELKSDIEKKDARNSDKVGEKVWEIAKKAYMSQYGVKKEPESKKDKETFDENVKNFILSIAHEAGEDVETYEHAIARIMSATNPIYGRGDERSKILDALLSAYAQNTHESEKGPTKGLRMRRLAHLRRELGSRFYHFYWHRKHKNTLREHGYDAEFDPSATSPEIIGTIEELLSTGEANTKQPHIKAKTYVRQKARYDRKAA